MRANLIIMIIFTNFNFIISLADADGCTLVEIRLRVILEALLLRLRFYVLDCQVFVHHFGSSLVLIQVLVRTFFGVHSKIAASVLIFLYWSYNHRLFSDSVAALFLLNLVYICTLHHVSLSLLATTFVV